MDEEEEEELKRLLCEAYEPDEVPEYEFPGAVVFISGFLIGSFFTAAILMLR